MKPSEMDPQFWHRIDKVLGAALDTPPGERAAFLDEACANDPALRVEVEALLTAHDRSADRFEPVAKADDTAEAMPATGPEGRRVGPFRLVEEIGRGGMGVVYRAVDTRLGRHVALKALPPWLGVGEEARRRFLAEARAVSTLDHPNIATLYETDATDDGQLYMVFAYYQGETLADRIARGALSPDEAIAIARDLAAGLEAAHREGIVHRDVKPSNVLLTESGDVKLLDFGVAKVVGEDATRPDHRLGTVAYMSPEQVSGAPVDARTDLWSLGLVLYEMLAGRRPFTGADTGSLIQSILHDDPEPPRNPAVKVPDGLNGVLSALLRKDPATRYGSAHELIEDLDAVRAGGPEAAIRQPPVGGRRGRRGPPRQLRRWRFLAASASVAVIALGAWLIAGPPGSPGTGSRVERIAVLPLDNRTGDPDQLYFVDGIHEALISELGRMGAFDVISRRSVLRFRDGTTPLPEIADVLGVDAVIEGSVLRDGDSLTVAASLVAVSPERQLWAANYRRAVGGVYEVAGEVARSVAREIGHDRAEADSSYAAPQEVDPRAYDAYVLGQFHLDQRDRAGFELAVKYLMHAIELDSTFAPAYTTLAEANGSAAFFGMLRPSVAMPRVRALAERALRFDSTLSEAHRVAGATKLYWDWDLEAAEKDARRALALNPSNAEAYGLLSEVLAVRGRYGEALQAIERGSELNRLVPFSAFRPAVVMIYGDEYDRAIERLREGLDFFSEFWQGHWLLCLSLAATGRDERALESCERAVALSGRATMALGALGFVYAHAGRRGEAEAVIAELRVRSALGYVSPSDIAVVHGALGEADTAFEWLARAFDQRDVNLVHLADIPLFDPLRADPRFGELRRAMGLID